MERERLANRRASVTFNFDHGGQRYQCSASRFPDGRVAEIFLASAKIGSGAQQHAECAAILCSLALQHGVPADTICHAVGGAVAIALELAEGTR